MREKGQIARANCFQVRFVFEGGLADLGELDGSDYATAVQASKRLLALHAHSWSTGNVPISALAESGTYHIRHAGTQRGSHVDIWNVLLNVVEDPRAVELGLAAVALYGQEVRTGIGSAARFLRDSLRYAIGQGQEQPRFRIEPVFESVIGNHEPLIDPDAAIQSRRARLRKVTNKVVYDVARPIGRSATALSIFVESELAVRIEESIKLRLLTEQIGDAVEALRLGSGQSDRSRMLFE